MTTFRPLPPPPDGLAAVVAEGRRRRRRRSVAGASAAGAAGAAVLVLALAVTLPAGSQDSLRPLPAASAPSPQRSLAPPSPAPTGSLAAPAAATGADGRPVTEPAGAAPPAPAQPADDADASSAAAPAAAAGYRTPDLRRDYDAPPQSARLCGLAYSNSSETDTAVGWCVATAATATDRGADLRVEVCRDGTTPGRLTFGTDHEVDLEVLDEGRVVWRWSAGRPPVEDPHELSAEVGACWSWTAPWTGVDSSGRPLAEGPYVLRVRSRSHQLEDADPQTTPFSL